MTTDRRAERRTALLGLLQQRGLDGLLVTHMANVRYLTGFSGTAALVLVLREETVFLSDFRYRTQAEAEIGNLARIEIVRDDEWRRLWQVLDEYAGVGTLGFEAHALSAAQAKKMQDAAPARVRLEAAGEPVEELRVRKEPGEVAAIRQAATLALEALDAVLGTVRPGQTELEVATRLEHELRVRGSEWHPFPTIVASGEHSALPHAGTGRRVLARGDWLLLDFGARVDGYCADVTRTVVVGQRADEKQCTLYALVQEAQRTVRQHLRPGMTGREADALARSVIEARGFADAFGHSLGHGLGLEVHEAPRLSRTNERPLPEGAVVTIEPGIYLPGWGGVRIEDDVYLGAEGVELLTDGETELKEIV